MRRDGLGRGEGAGAEYFDFISYSSAVLEPDSPRGLSVDAYSDRYRAVEVLRSTKG